MTRNAAATKTRVLVIGGGPSGLFFCHALETLFREGKAKRELFDVHCYERSSQPGGIWKACTDDEKMNMYEELWTNGPANCMEFADYTFDEHFGRPTTVYLPRQDVLNYINGRVTKNCPDFFKKYVTFRTEVKNVKYENERFTVSIHSMETNETRTEYFDKVLWACGDNGRPCVPEPLEKAFANFSGRKMHSSETGDLHRDFSGKRVLMIGGAYSAEDLALQACKLGVEKVYISTRNSKSEAIVGSIACWPFNKVEILEESIPVGVKDDNKTIRIAEVEWDEEHGCEPSKDNITDLEDIDTVVFCTGYSKVYDVLSEDLRPTLPGEYFELDIPKDWKMSENCLSKVLGDVEPSRPIHYYTSYTNPKMFLGVLISNPNMMINWTLGSYFPLIAADTTAWFLARYCSGVQQLPSREEVDRMNYELAMKDFDLPAKRYWMDKNYYQAIDNLSEAEEEDPKKYEKEWHEYELEEEIAGVKRLAGYMRYADYPMDLGTEEELNEQGKAYTNFDMSSEGHKVNTTADVIAKEPWRTYRDCDSEASSKFFSLHTGTRMVPLARPWMQLFHYFDPRSEEGKTEV